MPEKGKKDGVHAPVGLPEVEEGWRLRTSAMPSGG